MGENTFGHKRHDLPGRPGSPAGRSAGSDAPHGGPAGTYWRRRCMVLIIGLAVLTSAAWTLSDALRIKPQSGAAVAPRPWRSGPQITPAAGVPGAASASPALPRVRHRPDPSPAASGRLGGFGGFKPAFCSWHSIVLSLSATQVMFGPRQLPTFGLSVVSTQRGDCSFNVGPGHLALVIKEGPVRIWSSADCVSGSGSLVSALRRGVPTVVALSWNRRTSSPGCAGPPRSVPAGSYSGYATDGSLVSVPVAFGLS